MENFFFDGSNDYLKSFEKITQLQMEAGERLAKSQSELWSEWVDHGMTYTEVMMGQSSVDDFVKAQQTFFEGFGSRVKNITEDSIGVLTETNEKIASVFSQTQGDAVAKAAKTTAVPTAKPVKAAKPKPATKAASSKSTKKPATKRPSTKAKASSAAPEKADG